MKNLSFLNVLFLALAIFTISSCGSDDTVINIGPSVTLEDGTDITSTDSNVAAGATFTVRLSADKGDSPLKTLTITEDGTTLDASRIVIDAIATANNPQLITGDDVDGLTWDITVTAHSNEAEVFYSFDVTDDANETSSTSLLINTAGQAVGPTVALVGSSTLSVVPNSAVNIKIDATAGSNDLVSVAVYEDGTLITDLTRLDYDGANFTENPQPLNASDAASLDEEPITLRLGADGATYTFEVIDAGGLTGSFEVVINAGTAVSELTGILLNSAGPTGTGGLDLDTGMGSGSGAATADIKDEGIDAGPVATNWKKQISAAGTATLKFVGNDTALPEGSKYSNISTQEEIAGIFAVSNDLAGGVSNVVVVNDQFVVENNGSYYLLLVTNVNATTDNNADSYTFSIKK